MKISWIKLIWEVVIVAIVTLTLYGYLQPSEPKSVVTVDKPFVCTSAQYEAGECYPSTMPVPEIRPQPVIPPVIIRPQPVKKHTPKRVVKHLSCSQVPTVAYSFSLSTVLSTAKSRGLTDAQLADLTVCWQEHQNG